MLAKSDQILVIWLICRYNDTCYKLQNQAITASFYKKFIFAINADGDIYMGKEKRQNKVFVPNAAIIAVLSIILIGVSFFFVRVATLDTMQGLVASSKTSPASIVNNISSNSNTDTETASLESEDSLGSKPGMTSSSEVISDEVSKNDGLQDTDTEASLGEGSFSSDKTITDVDSGRVYHIKKGDTLSAISDETGISVQKLAQANAIDNVNLIYANSALQIPFD